MLAIWIAVIVWVYRDAESRGMSGVLWALLVFIGNLIGLLIYLIVRSESLPPAARRTESYICSSCKKFIDKNFRFCPHCGKGLK